MNKWLNRANVILAVLICATLIHYWASSLVHAQSSSVLQVSGNYAAHTSCVVVPPQTTACLASDGVWVSLNGAAFVQVGAGAGVTSFNGRTGAVVPIATDYPDAVTSVNGKTGAVVLGATTTIQ